MFAHDKLNSCSIPCVIISLRCVSLHIVKTVNYYRERGAIRTEEKKLEERLIGKSSLKKRTAIETRILPER
ncbi:hypothetical protein X777_13651 [Ooceraea biroi]|uniref:Uncharacterized protein n=1 Tax=Ooceraea biroi TaxID=2015173 RepID=A0A026VXP8_OOCBI|nr:hypothetical protein X777_13651 [Ooceraea biroi]